MDYGSRVLVIGQMVIGVIWVVAGVSKIRHGSGELQATFARVSPALDRGASTLGPVVPWLELALGLWLLVGFRPTYALGTTLLVLLVFTLFLVWLIRKGFDGDCGCFGTLSSSTPHQSIGRNLVLAVIAGVLAVLRMDAPDVYLWQTSVWDTIVAVGIGVLLVLSQSVVTWVRSIG